VSVTGIVLAGGRASRFGGPKLEAQLDGTAILALAIGAVSKVVDEVVVAGQKLPELGGVPGPGVRSIRLVPDEAEFGGPLQALAGALAMARGEIALVVGGDMPRVVPEVLAAMAAELVAHPEVRAVLLAAPADPRAAAEGRETVRQVLPLAIRIEPARAAAAEALAAGDRALRGMLDRLPCHEVPAATWLAHDPLAATLLDVDTEADLARLRASGEGDDLA
jgi:molybdopterin-guanine dinucleotide biosynthesis protein A